MAAEEKRKKGAGFVLFSKNNKNITIHKLIKATEIFNLKPLISIG